MSSHADIRGVCQREMTSKLVTLQLLMTYLFIMKVALFGT